MSERIRLNSPSSAICDGARRVLTNDWFVLVFLFLTAALVRWLFVLNNPHADGFLIYQGKPISDGWSYTVKAISIAQGHGMPPVKQAAVRPFYPITLACLYTWFGFSLWAVTVLNIVISGFTAALIYLCGRRGSAPAPVRPPASRTRRASAPQALRGTPCRGALSTRRRCPSRSRRDTTPRASRSSRRRARVSAGARCARACGSDCRRR